MRRIHCFIVISGTEREERRRILGMCETDRPNRRPVRFASAVMRNACNQKRIHFSSSPSIHRLPLACGPGESMRSIARIPFRAFRILSSSFPLIGWFGKQWGAQSVSELCARCLTNHAATNSRATSAMISAMVTVSISARISSGMTTAREGTNVTSDVSTSSAETRERVAR